ncbi:PH and SEC7 domain-containing protein 2 [Echinococcus granulosus]|nr:PH and SEC7 domain-containing protein 2 [Echinococcus granulosus]
MENGLTEVHLVSLPSEVKSLKLVDTNHPNNKDSGDASSSRTPSPTKKCHEMMFIDDGTASSSSSSATSTKEREKQRHTSGDTDRQVNTLQCRLIEPPPSLPPLPPPPPPPPPISSEVCERSPASSRRLPTVVVLGYQRVVAESQAAAERMHQQQQLLRQSTHPTDCPLTLSIGSSGLIDHGVPASPHGRDNRVRCPPPDDLHYLAQPPPPQSSPTNTSNDTTISPVVSSPQSPLASPPPPITLQGAASSDQSVSNSPLSSSPPDVGPLWPMIGPKAVAEDAESIAESVYHQPPKAADRSAAYRLARRLFTLDGFKISDVAKHLCKRNDFSQLVGEEFASFFDFTDQTLDTALRHFMTKFALTGESQERERILFHFSRRYVACNPGDFVSDDACHTLVCALMLLNTDLHSQSVTRKMSCQEFVSNLMELNNGENGYSVDELKRLYDAFKQEPLRWPVVEMPTFNLMYGGPPMGPVSSMLSTGLYGFGMNGATTPNGVGFVPPPASTVVSSPNLPAPSSASIGSGLSSGQSAPPYWQTAEPSLLAAWTTAAAAAAAGSGGSGGGAGGGYLRQAVFTSQAVLANSSSVGAANNNNSTESGGDLLKLFTNPFADMPKDISAREYMRGFVMRKCVMESYGKRTAMGKRGWKLFYARLRDLMLYLYKDAETAATATRTEEMVLSYMKQVYRFQLHCQHLRFYHEHQQRLQASLTSPAPPVSNPPKSGDSSSFTESTESASKMNDEKVEVVEGVENTDEVVEGRKKGEINSGQSPPPPLQTPKSNGAPTMPSVLEQQLAAAAFQLPPPPPPPPPPEAIICIAHAFACVAEDYVKKPNVFRLKTKDGSEYLMQVNDAKELEYWVDKINYVAGLLSAPSLPSAVGSDQTFHRPILPAGVTHLGLHEQLEGHQKLILELAGDLAELKRRRMSAPSQPNLTYLSREPSAPSPAPSSKSDSSAVTVVSESEVNQQLQQPPSSQLSYIPDSVLKSLQPSTAATLPSFATHQPERSLSSAFSTASLGRRRKKNFNALRGGTGSELAAQRAELDERVAFLEYELVRYKTYSHLLEAELTRLQRLPPPQTQSSPQPPSSLPVYGASPQIRGFWQVCGSADLLEEPSGSDGGGGGGLTTVVAGLPPPPKRSYGSSMGISSSGGMRQSRSHRMQYRQYQMQRRQQQFYSPGPSLLTSATVQNTHAEEETTPTTEAVEITSQGQENSLTAFYEVI